MFFRKNKSMNKRTAKNKLAYVKHNLLITKLISGRETKCLAFDKHIIII